MLSPEVLVVGAGPTGLVLALSLARRGVRVRLVDRKDGPAPESRAMGVQARTLEFYRQFGFADDVVARGVPAGTVHFREGGKDVARFSLRDMGEGVSPYPFLLCFPQDEHERVLVGHLEAIGVRVEWGMELAGFEVIDGGVRAALRRPREDAAEAAREEVCEVAYLCGCDGAHSRVRDGLGIGFSGGSYDQLFYVADVRVEARAGRGADRGEDPGIGRDIYANLGAEGLALMMPVRTSGMQRLIGIVPRALQPAQDGAAAQHRPALTYEDLRPAVEPLLGVHVTDVNWFSTYRVHHRVADRFRAGRCFLLGDAGHLHSPTGGQGMNTGIGDAINLGWKLAAVLRAGAEPALLDTYEPERIAFARTLVATTDRVFQRVVAPGRGAEILRTWIAPYALSFVAGFSAARRAMFATVSQVRIHYAESALSTGEAGHVAGGDRLPWVRTAGAPLGPGATDDHAGDEADDNFAPLRSLDWQVHVYGTVTPALHAAARALGLPVCAFAWSDAAGAAGLARDAAYLVRPDGYVALAQPAQDPEALRAFAARWGVRAAAVPPAPAVLADGTAPTARRVA